MNDGITVVTRDVRYIGTRSNGKVDNIAGTGITWTAFGDIREVDLKAANKMFSFPGVWQDADKPFEHLRVAEKAPETGAKQTFPPGSMRVELLPEHGVEHTPEKVEFMFNAVSDVVTKCGFKVVGYSDDQGDFHEVMFVTIEELKAEEAAAKKPAPAARKKAVK